MAESDLDIAIVGFNAVDSNALLKIIKPAILGAIHRIPRGGISVIIRADPDKILPGDKVKFRNIIYRVLDIREDAVRVGFNKWLAINSVERVGASK